MADSAGMVQTISRYRVRPIPRALTVAGSVVVVAVISLGAQLPVLTTVVIAMVGVGAIFVAWTNDSRGEIASLNEPTARLAHRRSAIAWCTLGVSLCLWELAAFFLGLPSTQASDAHPALTDLVEPLVAQGWGRAVGATLWVIGGIALVRRGFDR